MSLFFANLSGQIFRVSLIALAALIWRDAHNGWAVFWLVIAAMISGQFYETTKSVKLTDGQK